MCHRLKILPIIGIELHLAAPCINTTTHMYEIEVDHTRLPSDALAVQTRSRFLQARAITHIGHVAWEEHCTECAYPQCYATCDFYRPRNDRHCRRTVDGFSPVAATSILAGPIVRIGFRRWRNLTAHCHLALRHVDTVEGTERRLNALALAAAKAPRLGTAVGWPGLPSRLVRLLKRRSVTAAPRASEDTREPTSFSMDVFNPSSRAVELSLDIAAHNQGVQWIPYRKLLRIEAGFHRVLIPFEEIRPRLGGAREAAVRINPNIVEAADEGAALFFGLMSFVHEPGLPLLPAEAAKKVKVTVWDLDNTIWDGTLIEDGPGRVALKPGIREVIAELDRRGIVNSVASKNDERTALAELERLGLREFFVFPEIGWGPKSDALRRISRSFNVGEDTIAFIDDQPFEREEVRAANPMLRIFTHDQYLELPGREEFDVPVTDEARARRLFYRNQEVRQIALEHSGSDYLAFLRQSNIRVHIAPASTDLLDRIHELVQRTNQMNFSGNRYAKPDLLALLANQELDCYVADAQDNYGKCGHIGWAVVRVGSVPRVIDLAFSCRVQAKHVEHAVITFLMRRYASHGASEIEFVYRLTEKNRQIGQVFSDLGCTERSRNGDDFLYRRGIADALPEDSIVSVHFTGAPPPVISPPT